MNTVSAKPTADAAARPNPQAKILRKVFVHLRLALDFGEACVAWSDGRGGISLLKTVQSIIKMLTKIMPSLGNGSLNAVENGRVVM